MTTTEIRPTFETRRIAARFGVTLGEALGIQASDRAAMAMDWFGAMLNLRAVEFAAAQNYQIPVEAIVGADGMGDWGSEALVDHPAVHGEVYVERQDWDRVVDEAIDRDFFAPWS